MNHEKWEQLIQEACDHQVASLPASLKMSLMHRLFPPWASFAFLSQVLAGVLLVIGPAILASLSLSDYNSVPLPGLAYGAFGFMTLLWLVPMAWRIFQNSATDLALLSENIDEVLKLNVRRRLKAAE